MADVDTSAEAVERMAAWHMRRADVVPPHRETHGLHLRTAATLRALLSERDAASARAEAAEKARDVAIQEVAAVARDLGTTQYQRDAATAERDRLREALEKAAIAAEVESAGQAIAIIEAALAAAKDARHD